MLYNLIPLDVQGAGASNFQGILLIVLMIAIFYFMMIRPQQKKQKEMRKFRDNIQKGDNVISAGGIYGKVKEVRNDGSIIMSIADGVTIRIDKNSVYPSAAEAQTEGENNVTKG